jgi:cytochrome c-type biogenesis protein CcmH
MSGLFPAFALLTTVAVLAVLWPVFRRQRPQRRERFELEVYRDQLGEVERDRERGLIPAAEARAARLEIERRLLRAGAEAESPATETRSGRRGIVLAAALLVPTLAASLYAALGSPNLPDQPLAMRQEQAPQTPDGPDVQQMVARLESRLAQSPDDLEGWLMLGRSKAVLGDVQRSVEAFRRAQTLAPDDARAVGGLAEAEIQAAGGVVTPDAKGLLARLADLDPGDPRSAFYLGLADFQAGEHHSALERWRRLLAESTPDAEWRPQVIEGIRAAATALQLNPDAVLAQIPAAPSAGSRAPQPSAKEMADAAAMAPEERMAMIRGMVEKLQARMDADGGDVEGWLRLAQSRSVLGEGDRAKATYEKALTLHPDEPLLLKGYAKLLVGPVPTPSGLPEIGDQANDLLIKAARLQPDDPEIWWLLGVRALQDGHKDQARDAWEKVLARLDPAQPEYKSIKSRIDGLGG